MIKASVPLWVAVLEALRPLGEKPTRLIAGGLLLGALGVVLLVATLVILYAASKLLKLDAVLFGKH